MAEIERASWNSSEVSATVSSYFAMLKLELRGLPFNKSAENAALRNRLRGRSKAAVEFKHQNISAVLLENGWVYIAGYKPMKNAQSALRNEVEYRLRFDDELDVLMTRATNELRIMESDPLTLPRIAEPPQFVLGSATWTPRMTGIKRDYVFRDAKNRELGLAGELKIMQLEKQRLLERGRPDLAERIEHVALTQGDGLGYDILSFESSGAERFIEVKTTLYSIETPFFVSRNEVEASDTYGGQFHIHRIFSYLKNPGMYLLTGAMRDTCELRPINFLAGPKNALV